MFFNFILYIFRTKHDFLKYRRNESKQDTGKKGNIYTLFFPYIKASGKESAELKRGWVLFVVCFLVQLIHARDSGFVFV